MSTEPPSSQNKQPSPDMSIENIAELAEKIPEFSSILETVSRRLLASLRHSLGGCALPASGLFDWESAEAAARDAALRAEGNTTRVDESVPCDDCGAKYGADSVLVGISGGSDSTALLLLVALAARQGGHQRDGGARSVPAHDGGAQSVPAYDGCARSVPAHDGGAQSSLAVNACHVNHGLRGADADADERYCELLCQALGVPLSVRRLPVQSSSQSVASEESLRELRYQAFVEVAEQTGSAVVLLGHTLDDQAETMLFRALRGTSISGLRGIPCIRPLRPHLIVSRPALTFKRSDLRQILELAGISWRDDASNAVDQYSRNYIRNQVAPRLAERFPDYQSRLERTRLLSIEEEAVLDELAAELAESAAEPAESAAGLSNIWSLDALRSAAVAIVRRAIARGLRARSIEVSFDLVETIVQMVKRENADRVSLNGVWDIATGRTYLRWIDKTRENDRGGAPGGGGESVALEGVSVEFEHELRVPGLTIIAAHGIAVRVEEWSGADEQEAFPPGSAISGRFPPGLSAPNLFPPEDADEALVDLSRIEAPLVARSRREGDEIQPFGMAESVRLKKYLHGKKRKPPYGVLIADKRQVVWVPGVGLSERLRVVTRPTHRLTILRISADDVDIA